jgi:hypothetical protein
LVSLFFGTAQKSAIAGGRSGFLSGRGIKATHDRRDVQTPLRDASGENIGLIVLAYKNPDKSGNTDKDFFAAGTKLRDDLEKDIPSFAALFEPGK